MDINLNLLLKSVNDKITGTDDEIIFSLTDGDIRVSLGNTAYYISYKKMFEVIEMNGITSPPVHDYEERAIELLGKHIINQLFAAHGEKTYKDVAAHPSDILSILAPKNLIIFINDENMLTKIQPIEYKKGIRFWLKYIVTYQGLIFTMERGPEMSWVQIPESSYDLPKRDFVNIVATITKNFPIVT
jgi:hypothetical protein